MAFDFSLAGSSGVLDERTYGDLLLIVYRHSLATLAEELARDWIARLNAEEPNAPTLEELHRLLHGGSGSRSARRSRLAWVGHFVEYHGIDALCVWLQRLQARSHVSSRRGWTMGIGGGANGGGANGGGAGGGGAGGGASAANASPSSRLAAVERLLQCLWELMNGEVGMRHMLAADGAGVLALATLDDERCNLFFLARAIDPAVACLEVTDAVDEHVTRVQCIAIKLLTSAAAFSPLGHSRVLAAVRHVDELLLASSGPWMSGSLTSAAGSTSLGAAAAPNVADGGGGASSTSSLPSSASTRPHRFFRRIAESRATTDEGPLLDGLIGRAPRSIYSLCPGVASSSLHL